MSQLVYSVYSKDKLIKNNIFFHQAFLIFLNLFEIKTLNRSVRKYGICFSPQRKILLYDGQDPERTFTLGIEQTEVVETFICLGSFVSAAGDVSDRINSHIVKARVTYINLDHL